MYDTKEEANQKLAGSVVLFKDSPALIHEARGSKGKVHLSFQSLRNGVVDDAPILDIGWNFRNLGTRLGYVNVDTSKDDTPQSPVPYKESIFVTRMGIRNTHSCQGLSARNLRISSLKGSKKLGLPSRNVGFDNLRYRPYFCDMLELKYPDLSDIATEMHKDGTLMSKAFDRVFCIRRDDVGPFYLQYKQKDIGYTDDFYNFKISPEFDYLQEHLEYVNVKIR